MADEDSSPQPPEEEDYSQPLVSKRPQVSPQGKKKKDRPLVRAAITIAMLLVVLYLGLFTMGFMIGLSGGHPVTFDAGNLMESAKRMMGGGETQQDTTHAPTDAPSTAPEAPQPTETAAPAPTITAAPRPSLSPEEQKRVDADARDAGKYMGELYQKYGKDNPELFWESFNNVVDPPRR